MNLILLSCYEGTYMVLHREERQQLRFPIPPKGMAFPESRDSKYGNKGLTALPSGLNLQGL